LDKKTKGEENVGAGVKNRQARKRGGTPASDELVYYPNGGKTTAAAAKKRLWGGVTDF